MGKARDSGCRGVFAPADLLVMKESLEASWQAVERRHPQLSPAAAAQVRQRLAQAILRSRERGLTSQPALVRRALGAVDGASVSAETAKPDERSDRAAGEEADTPTV
jgi:hypothetical protein